MLGRFFCRGPIKVGSTEINQRSLAGLVVLVSLFSIVIGWEYVGYYPYMYNYRF